MMAGRKMYESCIKSYQKTVFQRENAETGWKNFKRIMLWNVIKDCDVTLMGNLEKCI